MPDDSTALLEYVAGTDGAPSTLFVVTRSGVSGSLLPTADSLKEPVARLVALLEAGKQADSLTRSLGRTILGPAVTLAARNHPADRDPRWSAASAAVRRAAPAGRASGRRALVHGARAVRGSGHRSAT